MRIKPKIGVEIHAQLLDNMKLFSEAKVDWRGRINSNVDAFDRAEPGSMPHLNWNCVRLALRAARHAHCEIAPVLLFDRKHYGHWDLPAGYQITQKRLPLGRNGRIDLLNGRTVNIKQIHLEQDSGKSFNLGDGRVVVDLNRAGVALIELVSQPELLSPSETALFVLRVHELLQDLRVCSGNMDEGVMRVDVNVNLQCQESGRVLTPRVELKNINGISTLQDAVASEINRQEGLLLLSANEDLLTKQQETRLFSPETNSTVLLRAKTEAYRHLPEYDLPEYPLDDIVDEESFLTRHDKIKIFQESHQTLAANNSDLLLRLWTRPAALPDLFEKSLLYVQDARFLLNWCVGEVLAVMNREDIEKLSFSPRKFAELVENVRSGRVDKEIAKLEMISAIKESRDIKTLVDPKHSLPPTDVDAEIDRIFAQHPDRVKFLKSPEGKERGSVDFFIGPLMKTFRGKISAVELKSLLISRLFKQ